MLGADRGLVALFDRRLEALEERLDRRAIAQVLEPLAARDVHTLLLLLVVRHTRERPRRAGARMVAEGVPPDSRNSPG